MNNIYGLNFKEFLEKTKDNKKDFKKRYKNTMKMLEENRLNIENEIRNKGFNSLFNEEITLEEELKLINNEIEKETKRYSYIRNL